MKMPGNLNMKNMMKQAEKMKKQMEEQIRQGLSLMKIPKILSWQFWIF